MLLLVMSLCVLPVRAQQLAELWITGSAVPGRVQKLELTADHRFRYAGSLKAGEVKIQTTRKKKKSTRYLVPLQEDADIANRGIGFVLSADAKAAGWQVGFAEDTYRFSVDMTDHTLRGELFRPWDELFIGGGALSCGWDRLHLEPFTRDSHDPNLWTWTGELKAHEKFEESHAFKLEGQLAWGPKQLHPFTAGEDPLTTTAVRGNGADTKWEVKREGRYRITVNVFRESFKAEYLGK